MPRKYVNAKPPTASALADEQRYIAQTNDEFRALVPAGANPWQWRLPSGNTIEQASGIELLQTGRILMELGSRKQQQVVVDVTPAGDGVYQVKIDGRIVGELHRHLGRGGGWYAIDVNGKSHYFGAGHPFATRDDAVEALVTRFA